MKLLKDASQEALFVTNLIVWLVAAILAIKMFFFTETWLGVWVTLAFIVVFIVVGFMAAFEISEREEKKRQARYLADAAKAEEKIATLRAEYERDWVFCGIKAEVPHYSLQTLAENPDSLFLLWQRSLETFDGKSRFYVQTIILGDSEAKSSATLMWKRKVAEIPPSA